jgi:hypothetical protein
MEVTFSEVVGMEELNDGRPRKVKNCKVGTVILPPTQNDSLHAPSISQIILIFSVTFLPLRDLKTYLCPCGSSEACTERTVSCAAALL